MPPEPSPKRVIAFIDGQNLYHAAKEAFGYTYPNYDPLALAGAICQRQDWQLAQVRFYTAVPEASHNPLWHGFWTAKLAHMGRQGVEVFSRSLRYRNKQVTLADGSTYSFLVGEEKGIDVRIALDIIRLGHRKEYDVAVVFSQDQDLSEVAKEIRLIAREQKLWLKIACAYPTSPTRRNRRGIDGTDWISIDRSTYNACIDRRNYRQEIP